MTNESDKYSVVNYQHQQYKIHDNETSCIRLIQIQPRMGNEDPTNSKIELVMKVMDLSPSNLEPGESDNPTGRRPSVRFDEELTAELPRECFGTLQSSISSSHQTQARDPTEKNNKGRFSRLVAKLKLKPDFQTKDLTFVPVTDYPRGDPIVRRRFKWGNYVAMSYTWGKVEEWETTAKDREEAAKKEEKEREKERIDPTYKRVIVEEDDRASYTYGDGEVHEVLLDGQRIRVRYNLWAALVAFREMAPFNVKEPKLRTWLWSDALCINQQDTDEGHKERKKQLPLMSRIYREAGNIIIHAGGADWDTTPWVFDYLQTISINYRTEYYEALDDAEPTIAHSHRFQARRELEKSARKWVEGAQVEMQTPARQDDTDYAMIALYDFFDRPYWRRLWIIQELAMAHHSAPFMCGGFVTQWRYIRDGALLLCMMADTVRDAMQRALKRNGRTMKREPSFEHVAAIAELAMSGNRTMVPQTGTMLLPLQHPIITVTGVRMPLIQTLPGSSIQQSLTLAAGSDCFMKRDRVLGLLAIPALSKQLPPKIDVHLANLPTTTDIYLGYTQACIQADHSLDILSLVNGGSNYPDEGRHLPSWCPPFHVKSKIGRIEGDWHAQPSRPKYNPNDFVSFEFEMKMGPKFEGNNMICPGWIIDTVDGLGGLSASDISSTIAGLLFKGGIVQPCFYPDWSATKTVPDYYYPGPQPDIQTIPDRIWSMLVGGTSTHGRKAPSSFSCLLDSFPESWPSNNDFLYKRNWDFLQANRDLPIDGKPLSSYFKFQPVKNVSNADISNNPVKHTDHKIAAAHRAMEARTKLRRLMTTSKRPLMGLVPASTQQGDKVIILPYHSRPLIASGIILRNAPMWSGDRVFKLKGEAFIPGVMNGELADSKELDAMPMCSFKFV